MSLTKYDVQQEVIDKWQGLLTKPKRPEDITRFVRNFLKEDRPNFSFESIRPQLIITEIQICSLHCISKGYVQFDVREGAKVPIGLNTLFHRTSEVFADILQILKRDGDVFSFDKLKNIYNTLRVDIKKRLETDADLTGILDVVARLVRFNVLLVCRSSTTDGHLQTSPPIQGEHFSTNHLITSLPSDNISGQPKMSAARTIEEILPGIVNR